MSEFKVGPHTYRIARKMNAMDQFHVSRRLGPAIIVCGVTFKMLLEGIQVSLDQWASVAGPVLEIVSHMSDEDVEYVIFKCCGVVDRQEGDRWAPLVSGGAKPKLMYGDDMDQFDLLRITVEVLRENLANFAKGMSADGTSTNG